MNNRWNQWVLNYSRGQQFDLLRGPGLRVAPDWQDLAYAADRPAVHRQPGRRGLGAVGPPPAGPLAAPAAARAEAPGALGVPWPPHDPPRTRAAACAALGDRGEALARELDALDRARYARPARRRGPRWWRDFSRRGARRGWRLSPPGAAGIGR
jgi:hypothetical protein